MRAWIASTMRSIFSGAAAKLSPVSEDEPIFTTMRLAFWISSRSGDSWPMARESSAMAVGAGKGVSGA